MEDLVGLIIFLIIVYRAIADKKRGRERASAHRRIEQESGVDFERIEEFAEKILGVEGLAEEIEDEEEVVPLSEPVSVTKAEVKASVSSPAIPLTQPEVKVGSPKKGSLFTGVDLKQAVIWSEILQKPKALRRR